MMQSEVFYGKKPVYGGVQAGGGAAGGLALAPLTQLDEQSNFEATMLSS
jgi:hypothetical protein